MDKPFQKTTRKKNNTFTNFTLRNTNKEEKMRDNQRKKGGQKEKGKDSPLAAKHN